MKSHDLHLPEWGPYTKKYFGISHIADSKRGWRFDLSLAPGFYRRKVNLPYVLGESGFHPWEASPGLEYYSYRHELEWKDQVYCDVSFAEADASTRLIRCEYVNQTDVSHGLVLHLLASLHFPASRAKAILPTGALWIDALDYQSFTYGEKRLGDGLISDMLLRGEVRGEGFVAGSGLVFGGSVGDHAVFSFEIASQTSSKALVVRYRSRQAGTVRMQVDGGASVVVEFPLTDGAFSSVTVELGSLPVGRRTVECTALDASSAEWDGLALVDSVLAQEVLFEPEERNSRPQLIEGPRPNTLILQYDGLPQRYGLAWTFDNFRVREFLTDDLNCLMCQTVHNHVSTVMEGSGDGNYTDVYLHPIALDPQSRQTLGAMVCCGTAEEVAARLAAYDPESSEAEEAFRAGREKAALPSGTSGGTEYEFSQARMSATTLTNVVYPAYARRSFIRHYAPGRWWDSLYTWDSGFIALGMLELDINRAVDCLDAYLTAPGDPYAAFVHHGSPLPVQHYAYQQLWNRTGSRELLARFYPGLRQYHHFLSGRDPRSSTRRLKSALLQTWCYFYNSGGWDDYPPQKFVHDHQLTASVTTVCNTAHVIRTAKILRMAAQELGEEQDIAAYDEDIALFTNALQTYSWDEASGYFGYVRHNEKGEPEGILRHESGANFDMGLDGFSPLVAGVCTPEQRQRLLGHLDSEKELRTPIGISTVDQSAPYYREDGYWNGAVWMPHQWFVWRALLDLGEVDMAFRIAQTGLDLWAHEVGASYSCFEHFIVKTGRGAGWHQFGGLSTPVLSWFASYYIPGRVTVGLDVWIRSQEFSSDHTRMEANMQFDALHGGPIAVVVVMNSAHKYRATWEGCEIPVRERVPGTLELVFDPQTASGHLVVVPRT